MVALVTPSAGPPPDEPPPGVDGAAPQRRSRTFFRIRVAVLLTILGGVLLFAWRDMRSRALRNDWSRTLDVALVVASTDLDEQVLARLRSRISFLEDRLDQELRRRRPEGPTPFEIHLFEVEAPAAAPPLPEGDGLVDAAQWSWDLRRFTAALDAAAGIEDRRFDARIYLLAREPIDARKKAVEGIGEQGGRVGLVEVELDVAMVDFALFVAAHELFHTVGAGDRYDAAGEPMVPEGLADPDAVPLFPQARTELMARHRAVAPGVSKPPESLEELVIGDVTAREIGWLVP